MNEKWLKANTPELFDYLSNNLLFTDSFTLKIYSILNDINDHPLCEVCSRNKVTIYQNRIFRKTCSNHCANKHPEKIQKTINNTDYKQKSEKTKKTCLEKYGKSSFFSTEHFRQKSKETCMKKYGVEYISQNESIKKKCAETFLKNYPIDSTQRQKLFSDTGEKRKICSERKKLIIEDFLNSCSVYNISIKYGHSQKTIYDIIHEYGHSGKIRTISSYETFISNFLNELGISFIQNSRSIIKPYELDFYIPEYNVAIEFNGLWWHSEKNKGRNYHIEKTKLCLEKNINLIHIFENEWIEKPQIIKSIIKSKLKKIQHRFFARNCTCSILTNDDVKEFLNKNHIQGYIAAKQHLGLFHDNNLVSVMSFSNSRYDKTSDWEMYRFCNKIDTHIVGAASKLFKYFLNNNNVNSIVTYADRRYFSGSMYEKLGFKYSHDSKPNYFYFYKKEYKLHSRLKFQKHKLKKLLDIFDATKTEYENMLLNGWNRIWDCGNSVYKYNYQGEN